MIQKTKIPIRNQQVAGSSPASSSTKGAVAKCSGPFVLFFPARAAGGAVPAGTAVFPAPPVADAAADDRDKRGRDQKEHDYAREVHTNTP